MLGKALQNGADNHDQRTSHDGPSPSVFLIEPWCDGYGENRTELVAGRDESQNARLDVGLSVLRVLVTISKVCTRQLPIPLLYFQR
jgi:hypothetical protein